MTEPFVSNASIYVPYVAAAVSQPTLTSPEVELEPVKECEQAPPTVLDWQAEETELLPSFGVERARELLMWLINLELRLPPYSEVSPA